VVEGGGPSRYGVDGDGVGELGAVADEDDVWSTVGVEADAEAGDSVVAVGAGIVFGGEGFDDYRPSEDGAVGEGGGDGVTAADRRTFATHFLGRVVGVQGPAVLTGVALAGVLPHNLRSSYRLTLGEGVAVADVEDEAGGLAHRLDADEVVADELGVALADEGEGEAGEVRDVGGGGLVLKQHGAVFGGPRFVLVFQHGSHHAELAGGDFAALAEHRGPFGHGLVLLALVEHRRPVEVGFFGHRAADAIRTFGEVAALGTLSGLRGGRETGRVATGQHKSILRRRVLCGRRTRSYS